MSNDSSTLASVRVVFLERIWLGLLVMASLLVPLSLARTFVTGWQPAYAAQFIMLITLGSGFLFRDRLSVRASALLLTVVMDLNGIIGVVSFGMFGANWWWLFLSSLILALCFRIRTGMIHALIAMVLLLVVGLAFVRGALELDFDASIYNAQFLPWAAMLGGPVLATVIVFWAFEPLLKELAQR